MSNKFRITERFTSQQEWAERGGLVQQHEERAQEANAAHEEAMQADADKRSGEMQEYDIIDRAWRAEHPAPVSDEEIAKQLEYIKDAVNQRERGHQWPISTQPQK